MRRFFLLSITLIFLASGLSACSSAHGSYPRMMSLEEMPAFVQSSPARVREAYQFSAANKELTESVPCYCGCVNIGHKSSYDCYISGAVGKNILTFDDHAANCGICVDITQDIMRLARQGNTADEISAYINDTYSKVGPPTVR